MQLRDYQREDVDKLKTMPTAGIFNEQRTGKTPTAISIVHECQCRKVLIICPKSAQYPWAAEFTSWTNGRPAVICSGTLQHRKNLIKTWEKGALIISYGASKQTATAPGVLAEVLAAQPDAVIADEAHRFKTPGTAVFTAMNKLTKIPKRLALSGTPAPGKPEEIFAILHWLKPNTFPSYWKFIEEYFYKLKRLRPDGKPYFEVGSFKPGKQKELQLVLDCISVQRKRIDVMPWLPQKDYTDIKLPLTASQKKQLEELEKYFETGDVMVQGVLDRLIRYRQICLAPELIGLRGSSPKLDWLLDYIEDYPETPTIVFSKFTSFLHVLEREIKKKYKKLPFGMITGETSAKERAAWVQSFQIGACNLLLINIDAGKEALTLDRGECIIFTDQYPPAADIQQAEDRFVATTKERANKPHTIIRLMMKDSYDEQVFKLIQHNASMIDLINDYKKYLANSV